MYGEWEIGDASQETNKVPRMTVKEILPSQGRELCPDTEGNQPRPEQRNYPFGGSPVCILLFFFSPNLSTQCPNEPEADPYLYSACLVLMTFLFFRPHTWLAKGAQPCITSTKVVCFHLLLTAGVGPRKEVRQSSSLPLTVVLEDAQYLFTH